MQDAFGILLIAPAAFLLPLVAARLRLPAVVVEILFGVVIGPSVLDLIHEHAFVGYLAELGFFLLMFLSGFEIDFAKLERGGPAQLLTGLAVFGATLGLAFVGGRALDHGPFVTLLLATTSVGLVVPTLRGTRRSSTPLGQAILICALLADFLTLIGTAIFALLREEGAGVELLRLPALFLAMLVLLLLLRRLAWWYPERFERLFDADDPEEIGIRACLALLFAFVGLSYLLHVEAILGAFLAGTLFALVFRHRGALERKLTGFSYGFFIPVFFIHVGIRFDLEGLLRPGAVAGAVRLIAVALLVKLLAAAILVVRRFTLREVLAAGVLLSSRLSLVIAVAALGVRLGLMDRALEAEVILLAVVTATLCPSLFRALLPPAEA